MIENEITLIIGGEMKGTVGTSWSAHMGQHLGSRGVTSRRSARRICSLEPVLGGSFCLFDHRTSATDLWRICSLEHVLGGSFCLFDHRTSATDL